MYNRSLKFIFRCSGLLVATVMVAVIVPSANGQVFLDYVDFETRLDELTSGAGVDDFTSGEVDTIKAGIKTNLETMFAGFTGITFTEVDPGGVRPELVFGLTGGGLGVADHIDFLNQDIGDTARVFTANFGFIIDEFSGSTDRDLQISQLTAAISGTSAHELGHNLGLRHHDAYGNLTYEGDPIATGGAQNTTVMATGSTGLGEAGRQAVRTFSVNSLVKLAYADTTITSGNPVPVSESGDAGSTLGTAQEIILEAIPVADRFGEVVIGEIGSGTDVDLYEIELVGGSVLTLDINNDYASGVPNDPVDTIVELLDSSGTVLFTNDDTLYSPSEFGAGTTRSTDSILLNANILTDGDYFVRLTSFGDGSGDYQLLIHTDMIAAIPEPATGLFIALGAIALGLRRRKQSI